MHAMAELDFTLGNYEDARSLVEQALVLRKRLLLRKQLLPKQIVNVEVYFDNKATEERNNDNYKQPRQ